MRQKGLEPNGITYNNAISACEKAKPSRMAWELSEEMQQQSVHV